MKKIIHKLRQRPEEERKHILHIVIFAAGIILLILWAYSLGRNFGGEEVKEEMKDDLQPFSVLKDTIVDGYESVNTSDSSFDVIE